MATRADREPRLGLYRRNRSRARAGALLRPTPGTLAWIEARQRPNPSAAPQPSPTERPEFYTREAAARRLGVGKTTVWELTNRGLIGVAYIGSKPLIPAIELERYIASLIEEARERAQACYRPQQRGR
jgi:excisionase family DNA binding protein